MQVLCIALIFAFSKFSDRLGESSQWTRWSCRQVLFLFSFFFFFCVCCCFCSVYIIYNIKINKCSAENGEKEDIYQLGIILLEVITGKLVSSTSELEEMKLQVLYTLTILSSFSSKIHMENLLLIFSLTVLFTA